MAKTKILVADDNPVLLLTLARVLEVNGFEVTTAKNVPDALKLILSGTYDVLLSDLHMPGPGDGLTVVSAMRHSNPKAITLLLSAFPEMKAAAEAIMRQTDEIMVKPMRVEALLDTIEQRLAEGKRSPHIVESVAAILERSVESSIQDWLKHVRLEPELMAIPMSDERRSEHLPQVFRDLVFRLQAFKALGTKELVSVAARKHGVTRRRQGYTADMMVEESRMLQVSIFQTLQNNLATIDFSVLLIGVMTIADEVDSQLSQAMKSYIDESAVDALPA